MKIVVSIPKSDTRDSFLPPENIALLESLGEVVMNPKDDEQWTEDELADALVGADMVLTAWGSPCLTEKALAKADRLKLLVHLCGTVVPFISDAMWDKGVRVMSGNDFFAESVAEGVIGYMLTALRDIPAYMDKFRNEGGWNPKNLSNQGLLDKTVGIVSYGAVAKHLVKMLKVFRVKINIYDIVPIPQADLDEYNMTQVSLEDVFAKSDIVTVQTPYNPKTHHLIGRELLEKMPAGALFVNTSRGPVINEPELVSVLGEGKIRAFLDVYEHEPPEDDDPLWSLPNVFMMPHKAGPTRDRHKYIAASLVSEAAKFVTDGTPLTHEIPREVAERMSRS